VLFSTGQFSGGGLLGAVGVDQEKPPGQGERPVGIDVADRDSGRYPQEETHLRLVQVSHPDDEPLQLGDSYYPSTIVQNLNIMNPADTKEGIDQILEDLGYIPTRYEDEIIWRMPTSDETEKLIIAAGTPVAAC
jgi:DNA-binding GntR family transcriptional regulator